PWRKQALDKCIDWVWEHLQKTEDIYPALAYGAMAFKAYGFSNDSPQIQTAIGALKRFQQTYDEPILPCMPQNERTVVPSYRRTIHQQCCISPVWDTPWALVALLESDSVSPKDPRLLKTGRWLLSKEVQNPKGDWRFKNPDGPVGGWSFEFLNEYFPDVDDTIEVIAALEAMALPEAEKRPAIQRGLDWILSMQNDDGGWGAFDKNNDLELVNKIPFADHGACLDPSSPDITGRALELFLKMGMDKEAKPIKKAIGYLKKSQEKFGGWFGRWGVNYIYGTWAVLTGLSLLGRNNPLKKQCDKACRWLLSIQNADGGFSESPESYVTKHYLPYPESVSSQTAWGLMGLVAGGYQHSLAVQKGVRFLLDHFENGVWEEKYFTGTGFPGHFYIRYHGYRYYFPLLALARYQNTINPKF
ncbi:MAG: prenyltransferase/squalene oxidase repeat-containing protein, partial [Deltaproteobacteria bacterium]|nr:prenyltransferase/squalene oxidase repeat-containing protein [Deltaproteobacteria bacterium]